METLVGMISMFGFNFTPLGWIPCDGRLLSIAEYEILYSLIGTTYGGDGMTNFAVPDFRGRMPIGKGQGPGLPDYYIGTMGGAETATLTVATMPKHRHTLHATTEDGDTNNPSGAYLGNSLVIDKEYKLNPADSSKVTMNAEVVGRTGMGQPFSIIQPVLAVNYCITPYGVYPSRN